MLGNANPESEIGFELSGLTIGEREMFDNAIEIAKIFAESENEHQKGLGQVIGALCAIILGTNELPPDVCRLVLAARKVAFEDQSSEALKELDEASEAFADRVPWDDEP